MQLQRNYTLPNCTLTLEGMGDPSGGLSPSASMTILVNAACQFLGKDSPLSGGSEFFSHLVATTSRYAQEQLSGLKSGATQDGIVRMQRLENGLHELTVYEPAGEAAEPDSIQKAELTTVQLFDLVEAIDQFLADGTVLPALKPTIAPLAKRDVPSQQPPVQRFAAPALGATGLAIAAAALFALPAPKHPTPVEGEAAQVEALDSPAATSTSGDPAGAPPTGEASDETVGETPTAGGATDPDEQGAVASAGAAAVEPKTAERLITDEVVLGAIGADLENQINQA
ncbi:MAG: DUF4335 domain-containing protein [Synechococcales cyanobacterium CRU_2_2]|nr:DUF4335 domain-containing protein [Synechococcales cyanobacterium CRU_2_2]